MSATARETEGAVPRLGGASPVRRWLRSRSGRRLRASRTGLVGALIVASFVLVALFAPLLAPPKGDCAADLTGARGAELGAAHVLRAVVAPPDACYRMPRLGLSNEPSPPRLEAPLGTVNGYDLRYGLVWGARTALLVGVVIVLVNVVLGAIIGVLAGFLGGWFDDLLMRATDIVYAFPSLVLSIVLASLLGKGLVNVVLSFILVGWAFYARLVRGEVLRVRSLEYIEASRALGTRSPRIMLRHVLPNAAKPLLAVVALDMGTIPLLVSALSYLGIGAPEGFADWGQLINLAQRWVQGPPGEPLAYWYVSLFPALVILLYSLGWNLVGDALQEGLDVRSPS